MNNIAKATEKVHPLTARDVLRVKGDRVYTTRPGQLIFEVIQLLVEHSLGSLVVTDEEGGVVGMLSERDVLRALAREPESLKDLKVSDLMTQRVIIGLEEDTLDQMLAVMTEKRIRHLPIMSDGKLAGILSIGDCVKAKAEHAEVAIHYLTDYITGKYPS
jgi:CBS domain-containing protein